MNEREAKIKAVEALLYCLNDSPFKPEMTVAYANVRHMAESLVNAIEQVERDFEMGK